ncbi:MAG: RdgB/HAM1 family non-canonical purine NTP pyrophosphatase [Bacteroidia bacterium]|jgi:XTP/dITP diphosphohydrolase|nr:RdgB/HAM1 family non-canonical purine NTP pyrophosphatase [Bacteroidia bacterium]
MELVFASSNQNKIKEVQAMLPPGIRLMGLTDIGITQEIPETGTTIAENAEIKARYVYDYLKNKGKEMAVLADDSGLEVKALNGAPGVYSARYAGTPKNDIANNTKLLEALNTETKREARFVTVLYLMNNNSSHIFEGEVLGTIAYEAKGNFGFGYDPLFIPRGYRSTFAELGDSIKNTISHRATAFKKCLMFLEKNTL